MNNYTENTRDTFNILRTAIIALAGQWRLRRAGAELKRRFAALEIAMGSDPVHCGLARAATDELLGFLESKPPSRLVDAALATARALDDALNGRGDGRFYSVSSDDHQTSAMEMTAEEMAEMVALTSTMPLDNTAAGDDCAICRLLERQRIARHASA